MSAAPYSSLLCRQERQTFFGDLADWIGNLPQRDVQQIAVDGVDGSGKTTFADELGQALQKQGRTVIRASVDDFHNPKALRYQRGRSSPEGFFLDSYNYLELKRVLLEPLCTGGLGKYRTAVFDHVLDQPVATPETQASSGSILILDGIFLHRPELRPYWNFSIYLDVTFDTSFLRMAERDGSLPHPEAAENRRYLEGQKLYLQECKPKHFATMTIDNNLTVPSIVNGNNVAPVSAG